MCGIAGLVGWDGRWSRAELAELASAMRDTLAHRGPDDAGAWVDPTGTCALAHRRLSIVDLSERGRQPMVTPDGQAALVFNGEIWDEAALRAELRARGYRYRSECDAETLLYLFASGRADNLARLSGMYAFATWNATTRRLFLARDPFGKKPLYVAQGEGWLAFASELRALAVLPCVTRRVDREALAEYLLLQYVHAPRSILQGCEKLPPGAWAAFQARDGGVLREGGAAAPWSPRGAHVSSTPYGPPPPGAVQAAADALLPVLRGAVERRLRSDVPLGAFLSGGVDSALVAAMVTRELGAPLHTFSIGFQGAPESEHEAARQAAGLLGATHHERMLEPDALELLPQVAALLDEPLGDSSCLPTYLLARFAREHVTVALTGDGGDELFGGYGRYRQTLDEDADWKRRALHLLRHRRPWSPGGAYVGSRWLLFPPPDVELLLGGAGARHAADLADGWAAALDADERPLIHRLRDLDARTYMPGAVLAKVDRMTMAVALEARCPLLDREVAAFAERLPADLCWQHGVSKPVLRALLARYVPERHAALPKLGFGLPARAWSRPSALELCEEWLLAPDARVAGLLDAGGLRRLLARQRSEGGFSIYQVWTLLVLEAWLRAHLPEPAAVAGAR
jgi:asparagine synthase (glutamine-hydrolysing)